MRASQINGAPKGSLGGATAACRTGIVGSLEAGLDAPPRGQRKAAYRKPTSLAAHGFGKELELLEGEGACEGQG